MSNQKEASNPLQSITPILIIGLITYFALQYFNPSTKTSVSNKNEISKNINSEENSKNKKEGFDYNKKSNLSNFNFIKPNNLNSKIEKINFQTDNYFVTLDPIGGRINKLYLKSKKEYPIPKQAILKSNDNFSIENNALEVTLYEGLDFQPHLYYFGENSFELGDPILNHAIFTLQNNTTTTATTESNKDIQEFIFTAPISFKNQKLELIKIYRFFKEENFFQQITVLKNLEKKEFNLDFTQNNQKYRGSLFYKPFSDIGSIDNLVPESMGVAGRFFLYNNSLNQRPNIYNANTTNSGGGCNSNSNPTGTHSSEVKYENGLTFIGSHSRYFFGYNEFITSNNSFLNMPDGYVYKNFTNVGSKETMSAVFLNFALAPKESKDITWKDLSLQNNNSNKTPYQQIAQLQSERKDALILNNLVYVGKRDNLDHSFKNAFIFKNFFNKDVPNANASKTIYYSSYTALFSGVQDAILFVMHILYKFIGNYGWCIVFFAIIFKLLTYPLTKMQMQSMQRMSALRPELDNLNKEFADNPQEKQKRVMALFKKNNVNPAKGCLPVLIQMPIFVALYSAFTSSMELWYSPFIFWMKDLSLPDSVAVIPYLGIQLNILPLLMVGSQIGYQRFTTVPTDANQKVMMYLMPVIMLFFFWNIPSGVTLYWTLQNLISIAWQLYVKFFGRVEISLKSKNNKKK